MDAVLEAICHDLGLTSVSVGRYDMAKTHKIAVFLHWEVGGERECATGSGDTVDDALRMAKADMANHRPGASISPTPLSDSPFFDTEDRSGEAA